MVQNQTSLPRILQKPSRSKEKTRTAKAKTSPPLVPLPTKAERKRQRKERRKQAALQQRHLKLADSRILQHNKDLQRKYGFVSNYHLPPWANFENTAGKLDVSLLQSNIHNKSCRHLLKQHVLPAGTNLLLGLNLNYCIKPSSVTDMTKTTFSCVSNDIRRMFHLRETLGGN